MDLWDGDFDPNLCFNGSLDLERLDDSLSLTGSLKILENIFKSMIETVFNKYGRWAMHG